jgi:hypothetical protein
MVESFEELLKKVPKNIRVYSFFDDSNFVRENPDFEPEKVVYVDDLFEWVLDASIDDFLRAKKCVVLRRMIEWAVDPKQVIIKKKKRVKP